MNASRRHPEIAYLSLGSNLGDRWEYLKKAEEGIRTDEDIEHLVSSSVLETPPLGRTAQPAFLNRVLKVRTCLSPSALLEVLLGLEASLGRTRTVRWGARTIDIDILLYGREVTDTPSLVIPHRELFRRPFLVYLLVELDRDITDPVSGRRLADCMRAWGEGTLLQVGKSYRGEPC